METDIAAQIQEREQRHLLQNYARYPLALDRGKGSYLWDFKGKRYLDLITGIGVNALGHGHPRILKAIREQSARLIHCSNLYYHEFQGKLAERLCKMSGLDRVFFSNSGAESVEGAIKMMRAHGHRIDPLSKFEIITLDNSFHGRTCGAISVTGNPKYRKDFEPLLPGVRFVPANDIRALESAFSERTAGVIIEVIQGEGGIYPVGLPLLKKARQLCDQFDALLVFDEIQCGIGRAGVHFAYQSLEERILPDVMVTAKPIAVGLPLGAVAANERAAAAITAGMHGSTFGGGVLATRVALEVMDLIDELLPNIRARSDQFKDGLEKLKSKHGFITDVRVFGLMIGIELDRPGKQLVTDAMNAGLLINCTHDTVLRFLPPFTISEREVASALRILGKLFTKPPALPESQ
ncbi:MAG: aspartate aminotransferase family protein [Acidobacteria bacterium]|nr:aspartate aminotransferase family protein [Acidobacteriota bacterium]